MILSVLHLSYEEPSSVEGRRLCAGGGCNVSPMCLEPGPSTYTVTNATLQHLDRASSQTTSFVSWTCHVSCSCVLGFRQVPLEALQQLLSPHLPDLTTEAVRTVFHAAWLLLPTSIRMAEAQADENRSWLCATAELSWRREVVTSGVFMHAPLTAAERKAARTCPGSCDLRSYIVLLVPSLQYIDTSKCTRASPTCRAHM